MCRRDINKKDFERLFKDYYESLYFHALSFTHDTEVSKDVVNDTFTYLWNNRKDYDFSNSVRPLLYALVRSRCIDHIRQNGVKRKYFDYASAFFEYTEEDYIDYGDVLERIKAEIETLPDKSRQIFKMCFLEGKKYKEIGEELGITINTVKTHISKSLKRLRQKFPKDILLYFYIAGR